MEHPDELVTAIDMLLDGGLGVTVMGDHVRTTLSTIGCPSSLPVLSGAVYPI
jgi:hypothetical protein